MDDGTVVLPIDGCLDLHTFSPGEVGDLVDDYIGACIEQCIFEIRIVHGKGKGVLRETVHSRLRRNPRVAGFSLDAGPSGWGATIVHLKRDAS